jgi:hypothetical protein
LDINPLSDAWFANIFSHFIGCLFTLLIVCLVQKAFSFVTSLVCFCLCCIAFRFILKNFIHTKVILPLHFLLVVSVSGLTFKPLIYVELIFVCRVRWGSNFILLHVVIHNCIFVPLLKINWMWMCGSISGFPTRYFWYYVGLVPIFLPVPCCFEYCNFVKDFEMWSCVAFGFVLFA